MPQGRRRAALVFHSNRPWNRGGLQSETLGSSIGDGGVDASLSDPEAVGDSDIVWISAAIQAITIVQRNAEMTVVSTVLE